MILPLILSLLPSFTPQIEVKEISASQLPPSATYKGVFQKGFTWEDANGKNLLILSTQGPYQEKIPRETYGPEESKFLYGAQYVLKGDHAQLLWDIKDFELHCAFDLSVSFLEKGFRVTDLDQNGISETTLAYKLACRSDVTPARMKVLMHEGGIKYGLRGQMCLFSPPHEGFQFDESRLSEEEKTTLTYRVSEGRYANTRDFDDAPAAFLPFAQSLWKELVVESF